MTRSGTIVDSSVLLDGAHAAVTGRPLVTRDPRRVATYIPGTELISP